jgi:hypothetical protein
LLSARTLAALSLIAALGLTTLGARAEEPFRTVVRVAGADDEALLARVRGQTHDLGGELIVARSDALEIRAGEQLLAAEELASRHHAQVVVWFQPAGPDVLLVYVMMPANGRVLLRKLAIPPNGRSTVFEQAAVIVRYTLRALAKGATIGVAREQAVRDAEGEALPSPPPAPKPAPPPPATPREQPPPPTTPPPASAGLSLRGIVNAGWYAGYEGNDLLNGPSFRLALEARHWEVGLGARIGLPNEITTPFATEHLSRYAAGVSGGAHWEPARQLHVCACLELGAIFWRRSTASTVGGAEALPPRTTVSPLIGPYLRATYRFRLPANMEVGLGALAGIDIVPRTPTLGYLSVDRTFIATQEPWVVEPRLEGVVELVLPSP